MIDTHCHIAGDEFALDLTEVAARARAAGVFRAVCILAADDAQEIERIGAVRAAWPGVRFAAGIHPHAAGTYVGRVEESAAFTKRALAAADAVALGEIGLDYHYDFAPKDVQREVFSAQIGVAIDSDLPVVIHTREAMDDTVAVLKSAGQGRVRGIIHCFTGSSDDARRALDLGFYISFSGILTFPAAQSLRDAAALVPVDRLLVETDAPFLAPVPYRGKRNEPAYVMETLAALAALKGLTPAAAADVIVENVARVF
jgi:TatD DNase family protein